MSTAGQQYRKAHAIIVRNYFTASMSVHIIYYYTKKTEGKIQFEKNKLQQGQRKECKSIKKKKCSYSYTGPTACDYRYIFRIQKVLCASRLYCYTHLREY